MSIYPGQDFNPDDENIVDLGYWDPGAEEADVPADSAETVPDISDAPDNPWTQADAATIYAHHKKHETVVAASDEMLSRVELTPGGVKSAVEAILAVADVPVSTREFAAALLVSERAVEAAIDELYTEYQGFTDAQGVAHEPRGFELRRIDGGWRLYARDDFSPWVARFVTGAQGKKLTQAQLETLAVIAYQQPVTRSYVAQVRGVSVDAAFRLLKQRGLITETVPEEGTGAAQFITTDELLHQLGLDSLNDLPKLAPFLPDSNDIEVTG